MIGNGKAPREIASALAWPTTVVVILVGLLALAPSGWMRVTLVVLGVGWGFGVWIAYHSTRRTVRLIFGAIAAAAVVMTALVVTLPSEEVAPEPREPSSPTATSSTSPSASPNRTVAAGDCLRHSGNIDVRSDADIQDSEEVRPSKPSGDLGSLAIAPCNEPHELEVLPYSGSPTDEFCGRAAVNASLGGWHWSNRLVGGRVADGLCAVGVRAYSRLQTIDWPLGAADNPVLRYGACSRESSFPPAAYVPNFYVPCESGIYLHVSVRARTEGDALAFCNQFLIGDQFGRAVASRHSKLSSSPTVLSLECLIELN